MTIRHLKIFICVCKHNSMTKAAEELFIAQPAVSNTIAEMEKTLAISHATQDYLCPDLKLHKEGDCVESKKLEKCNVILCRAKGKNYWMITNKDHKRDKILSIQNVKINPDDLLDVWEKEGFKSAAENLSIFIEYGKDGDSFPLTL